MKRILLLFALASVAHGSCSPNVNWNGAVCKFMKKMILSKNYKREYDKINNWLVDNLASREAPDNIVAVSDHFLGPGRRRSIRMVEAATRLVAMADSSFQEVKCTREAMEILRANQASTRHYMNDLAMRRIDRIVYHYSRQHSLDCRSVYPAKASIVTSDFESPNARHVIRFVGDRLSRWTESYLDDELRFMRKVVRRVPADLIVNFINSQEPAPIEPAQNEKTGKRYLQKQAVQGLVSRHIFEPCEQFVLQMMSVMVPCLFDAYSQPHRYEMDRYGTFIKSIVGFYWCHAVLNDKKLVLRRVNAHLYHEFSLDN